MQRMRFVALTAVLALLASCRTTSSVGAQHAGDREPARATRPAEWAQPIDRPGLPNLHQVTPTLYRGAQPDPEGFVELERMGVRTVLSLRAFHSDDLPTGSHLNEERISFKTWHPEREDVVKFLRIVTDESKQPVFVHCEHGADRTGMMLAIHRVVVQGWSKDDAIREMVEGGYEFHSIWQNVIDFVRELDVERVRREAGLIASSTGR